MKKILLTTVTAGLIGCGGGGGESKPVPTPVDPAPEPPIETPQDEVQIPFGEEPGDGVYFIPFGEVPIPFNVEPFEVPEGEEPEYMKRVQLPQMSQVPNDNPACDGYEFVCAELLNVTFFFNTRGRAYVHPVYDYNTTEEHTAYLKENHESLSVSTWRPDELHGQFYGDYDHSVGIYWDNWLRDEIPTTSHDLLGVHSIVDPEIQSGNLSYYVAKKSPSTAWCSPMGGCTESTYEIKRELHYDEYSNTASVTTDLAKDIGLYDYKPDTSVVLIKDVPGKATGTRFNAHMDDYVGVILGRGMGAYHELSVVTYSEINNTTEFSPLEP
ncbi:hypothetical protein JCM19236_440 [Vibrio sp. JCM 19236]|nr:hypothetical protein JCM19236_440 [Vibrio sp. JCM 19236]